MNNITKYKDKPISLHENIVNAARELFSYFGFKKTAMDDIAKKARVAKGTLYNYFVSKNKLIQTVVQKEGHALNSRMQEAVRNQKTPQLKFREMIIAKIKFAKELSLLYKINQHDLDEILPFLRYEIDEILRQETNLIKDILEEGKNSSEFREIDIFYTAQVLGIMIKGFEIRWAFEMDINESINEIDNFLQIVFHGLERQL